MGKIKDGYDIVKDFSKGMSNFRLYRRNIK